MPAELPISYPDLEKLCEDHGTPLQLYSESQMVDNATHLLSTFREQFADFQQFFAVKALPNPAVLKVLTNLGFGLDCSSTAELYIAEKLGIPGSKVMYTSNYTSKQDLARAFDQQVIINLDDVSLIESLVEVRGRCPELISFRLNPGLGRTDSTTKSNVLGGPNAKFGVAPDDIVEAYRQAKAHGAKRFGIHMMTGSCVLNDDYWQETVTMLLSVISRIREALGIEFEFMNIGGGLGIPYKPPPEQAPVDLPGLVLKLKAVFDKMEEEATKQATGTKQWKRPSLMMENGRYITGPYGWLIARCQAIKQNAFGTYYGLDACMANLMRPGMYDSYHHITVPKYERYKQCTNTTAVMNGDSNHEVVAKENANVVGTLCENNDWFAKDRSLPKSQVGDLFVIHDTGAHSHSMGFQYNGKLRAPELLLRKDGTVSLIRERETIEGLYTNTILPKDL